jgi:3',5'-cyclic AMP phosphodiesterase CpdA
VSFTLAHLSDAHLSNLRKRLVLRNFSGKRVVGGFSWFLKRRHRHLQMVADAVRADILAARPDHVALTGDLVNIAAWNEFPEAAHWVKGFGPPDRLTFVPGNHDAYVPVPWASGLAHLAPWMMPDKATSNDDTIAFPFLRLRRNIALLGLNSGTPQRYHLAGGTLGEAQRRDAGHLLQQLGEQGFFRIVMIHHPPLPGLSIRRKALTDAEETQAMLKESGCELVLHGHNHTSTLHWLETAAGPAPVVGVPSASIVGDEKHQPGGWNKFHIRRSQGRWTIELTHHRWNASTARVDAHPTQILSAP